MTSEKYAERELHVLRTSLSASLVLAVVAVAWGLAAV